MDGPQVRPFALFFGVQQAIGKSVWNFVDRPSFISIELCLKVKFFKEGFDIKKFFEKLNF